MIKHPFVAFSLFGILLLSACVTINIYFPAAEAEEAAEQIVDDILEALPATKKMIKKSMNDGALLPTKNNFVIAFNPLDLFFPAAQAAPKFSVSATAVKRIQGRIKKRISSLRPFLAKGGIGFSKDGLVLMKDKAKISLKNRKKVANLIKDENKDRKNLYKTIARVNNHPEWEADIQGVFAKKWIKGASKGWWVQNSKGQWRQK